MQLSAIVSSNPTGKTNKQFLFHILFQCNVTNVLLSTRILPNIITNIPSYFSSIQVICLTRLSVCKQIQVTKQLLRTRKDFTFHMMDNRGHEHDQLVSIFMQSRLPWLRSRVMTKCDAFQCASGRKGHHTNNQ